MKACFQEGISLKAMNSLMRPLVNGWNGVCLIIPIIRKQRKEDRDLRSVWVIQGSQIIIITTTNNNKMWYQAGGTAVEGLRGGGVASMRITLMFVFKPSTE